MLCYFTSLCAQTPHENAQRDSLYIQEAEDRFEPIKVLHAEPLYIDLIRDLGARRGEREWNVGMGLTDNTIYDRYEALIEYEWAPINRLGLVVELPFSFYYPVTENGSAPSNRLNSLKLAGQYSFLVSERRTYRRTAPKPSHSRWPVGVNRRVTGRGERERYELPDSVGTGRCIIFAEDN